jgi:hypothetical protein
LPISSGSLRKCTKTAPMESFRAGLMMHNLATCSWDSVLFAAIDPPTGHCRVSKSLKFHQITFDKNSLSSLLQSPQTPLKILCASNGSPPFPTTPLSHVSGKSREPTLFFNIPFCKNRGSLKVCSILANSRDVKYRVSHGWKNSRYFGDRVLFFSMEITLR